MKRIIVIMLAAFCTAGCWFSRERENPEEVLALMRADTAWISELDSLAAIAVGPGAECIDPVWHLFSWEGRTFFHNPDWGGVLEIPGDFLPEDDLHQAELSFHGTRAWSPDSLIVIGFYAGFGGMWEDVEENEVLVERNVNEDGIVFYGRTIPKGPHGVEYAVSLQYPEGLEERVADILPMIDRYPYGPDGKLHPGEAVL